MYWISRYNCFGLWRCRRQLETSLFALYILSMSCIIIYSASAITITYHESVVAIVYYHARLRSMRSEYMLSARRPQTRLSLIDCGGVNKSR